jgi:hypothetical protein
VGLALVALHGNELRTPFGGARLLRLPAEWPLSKRLPSNRERWLISRRDGR